MQVLIIGKGTTAKGAKQLLESLGAKTTWVTDQDPIWSKDMFAPFSFVVLSPGIAPNNKWVKAATLAGLTTISEFDLGALFLHTKNTIGITGTNGKTTIVRLTNHILNQHSKSYSLENIGIPLCQKVTEIQNTDFAVFEFSSFVLFQSKLVAPHVAIISNITPDHQNYHGTFSNYMSAKLNLLKNQTPNDYCIFSATDKHKKIYQKAAKGQIIWVGKNKGKNCIYVKNQNIIFKKDNINRVVAKLNQISLKGKHNLINAQMAIAACCCFCVPAKTIQNALLSFVGLPHRIESVATINGVEFVNDSKSTNPSSTMVAVEAISAPKILLLGGYEKGLDVKKMFKSIKNKVKAVVCYGACGERFKNTAKKFKINQIYYEKNLKNAVKKSKNIAKSGDVVLLSPATSSFDEFSGYEMRGDFFKQIVHELEKDQTKTKTQL